jgi:hypothetical protein
MQHHFVVIGGHGGCDATQGDLIQVSDPGKTRAQHQGPA